MAAIYIMGGEYMDYEEFIPSRLAKLRMQKGDSAREMSLALGQADNYINAIENRKTLPSMTSFIYICEYLSITPGDFFESENNNPGKIKEVTDDLKKLDEKNFSHIAEVIKWLATKSEKK